jgi:formylglycine-generating enzyme required for sulfatase activity
MHKKPVYSAFFLLLSLGLLALLAVAFAEDKPKVAVVQFDSIGVEPSLGMAASEILTTHLASREQAFRVVERTQLQKAMQELGYQTSALVDPESAVQIGKHLGARYIVVGSVTRFGSSYSLNARIVEVETAETRSVEPLTTPELNPTSVIELSQKIAIRLNRLIAPALAPSPLPLNGLDRATPRPPLPTPSGANSQAPVPLKQIGQMISIPAGHFLRGDQFNEGQEDERPARTIYLDAFWIMEHEVTQKQYMGFIQATGRKPPLKCHYGKPSWDPDGATADYPVVCVNWKDANAYCNWAGMRLPTEAEWEKAARGPQGLRFAWGNASPSCEKSSFSGCKGSEAGLRAVGSKPLGLSPYGLHDMTGSVWEWVQDWYDSRYYAQSPESNPTGPAGKGEKATKVLRSGSYGHDAFAIRASNRSDLDIEYTSHFTGFRCAR